MKFDELKTPAYVIDEKNNQIVFTNIPIDTNGERIRSEITVGS